MSDVVIKHKSVYIQPVAMRKIEYYTAAAHGEVSGLGILELDKDGDLIIQEVFLLEQESSSADTELDGEAISKLMHQLITEGKDPSQLKFWWHCVTGDTPILLADGRMLTAKEVYELDKPMVMAYDKDKDQIVPAPVRNKKVFNAPVYTIKTTLNREITVTGNHKMLTPYGWQETSQLVIGNKIGIPGKFSLPINTKLPEYEEQDGQCKYKKCKGGVTLGWRYVTIPSKMTIELAKLLGWIVSEGNLDKGTRMLHISQKNERTLRKINSLLFKVFGVRGENYTPPSDETRDRCSEIRLTDYKAVGNYLNQLGIREGRGIKRIPSCIFTAPQEMQEAFIDSMVAGDGSLDRRGRILYRRIYTAYKELASDLMYLLSMLGFRAGVRPMSQNFPRGCKKIYDVYWNSTDKCSDTIEWVEIKSIQEAGEQQVYALSVPVHRNYICGHGPFISHNSHSNMGVFWSGTDHACAEVLSKEYAISMVVNKKNQKLARLDIYSPIRITVDNIAINELADEDEELKKQCEAEVREKVRPGRIVYAGGFRGGYYNPNQAHALGYSPRRQHKQPDDGYFDQDGHWIDDWNDSYAQAAGAQNDKQSTIKPILIEDIERMETLSQQYGVLNKITWMVYIRETFLDILRTRYEVFNHRPKVNCALIGTYSDTMNACKACPSIELCQRMTTMIQETNEVIKQEKDRLEQSKQPASHK